MRSDSRFTHTLITSKAKAPRIASWFGHSELSQGLETMRSRIEIGCINPGNCNDCGHALSDSRTMGLPNLSGRRKMKKLKRTRNSRRLIDAQVRMSLRD